MQIKEVSAITGLTKKTIRFYEDSGLIQPAKRTLNGRAFRDYSKADVAQLNEIAILRKAHFTIDEIRELQADPQAVQTIFGEYYDRVKKEKLEMDRLFAVLDRISACTFTSKVDLVQEIAKATETMNLPKIDVHPHFRYIDDLEEKLGLKVKTSKSRKAGLKRTAAMTQSASLAQFQTKPGVRDGSMSGSSVIMTMRMMDDE